jgi:hypothetical protein
MALGNRGSLLGIQFFRRGYAWLCAPLVHIPNRATSARRKPFSADRGGACADPAVAGQPPLAAAALLFTLSVVFTFANAAIFLAEGITVPMIVGAALIVGLCR